MLFKRLFFCLLTLQLFLGACTPVNPGKDSDTVRALKIAISKEGVYQISSQDLVSAGWDISKLKSDQLGLLLRGLEQPFWVDEENQGFRLRFYALGSSSRYTDQNVYWLVDKKSAAEFSTSSGENSRSLVNSLTDSDLVQEIKSTSNVSIASLHLEENSIYSPQVESDDPWFWLSIPAPQTQEFKFELDQVAPGQGKLHIHIWATTEAEQDPDHHLRISLNGELLNDHLWDGKGESTIPSSIPTGLLVNGTNTILLDYPGDTGVAADINLLDWISIQYPRQLVAQEDRLGFIGSGGRQDLAGFSGAAQIYDVSQPENVTRVISKPAESQTILFEGQAGHRYLALGSKGFLEPDSMVPAVLEPDLKDASNGADYLAIGPVDLLNSLQPLLDHRRSQGLTPMTVPVEAIYDQFNDGFAEPQAIQSFLRYAHTDWYLGPRYVILVGDSTYDPRGYLGPSEANRLPTFFTYTVYGGETATDIPFVQMDGDQYLEIALGRLPAQDSRQVNLWVDKILRYEQDAGMEGWETKVLAIADGQDRAFKRDAQKFLDRFPQQYQKSLLNPPPGSADAHLEIVQQMDQGSLFVAYFGHGSVNMWGKDRLFSSQDVEKLANQDRLPVIVNMTCLTGLFTHPQVESLAEALLWEKNGGSVAVLAPTSLTLPTDQSFLSNAFVDAYVSNPKGSLGDILVEARNNIPGDSPGTLDVLRTFLLFGDPAMPVKAP
jgi:hypothetical protein